MKVNRKDLRRLNTLSTMADNLIYAFAGLSDETKDALKTKFPNDTEQLVVSFKENVTELINPIKSRSNVRS